MKKLSLLVGLLFVTYGARAQVSVEILLAQEQYLRDESLPIAVRLVNRSGQALLFGKQKDWLTFTVEQLDGAPVRRLGEVPVQGEFELESAQTATRTVDLMPYFDFSLAGRYRVTATVHIDAWNADLNSRAKTFDISSGSKIWEQEFGVPGSGDPPEVRKYHLVQAVRGQRPTLYLRLTDLSDHTVFTVTALGPLVSFARPEAQLDKESRLHVLFQTGAKLFLYYLILPNGQPLIRQVHEYAGSKPLLKLNEEGLIGVAGGVRRITQEDLPPPTESQLRFRPPTSPPPDAPRGPPPKGQPPPRKP